MADAWQKIKEDNPIPAVMGRVCYHRCEQVCYRASLDQAIGIHNIERRIGDYGLEHGLQVDAAPARSERVAVIGSGPAGLSAAYHLARKGYRITVYEADDRPGGLLRQGIPAYRLPRSILDAEIQGIADLGVKFICGAAVGKEAPWDDLKAFSAVVVSARSAQSGRLNIPGDESSGILDGLAFLRSLNANGASVGKSVLVIGGGSAAIEGARAALRLGAQEVTIVYSDTREEMPAREFEVHDAEEEGIKLMFLVAPLTASQEGGQTRLHLQRMQPGERDGKRRPVPIPGDEFDLLADTVLVAIGQQADLRFLPERIRERWQALAGGEAVQIEGQWFIGAGDILSGPSSVAHAIGNGKRAAAQLGALLQGQELPAKARRRGVRLDSFNMTYFASAPRQEPPVLAPASRVKGFDEVTGGLSDEALLAEAGRCFHCGDCNSCGNCWIFCPEMAVTATGSEGPDGLPRYQIDYRTCKGCGICVHECPRSAIILEEEIS
jgi:NADPH-dependent glutamate synthase beta subunit-like oxidoreductase